MVKAVLRDDQPNWPGVPTVGAKPDVALADDMPSTVQVSTDVHPNVTVKQRNRTGFDDDGNPQFEWVDVVTGDAIVWEMRTDWDPDQGVTVIKGQCTILYDGDLTVTESAVVEENNAADDRRYLVTQVGQVPGVLSLSLERVSGG